MAGVRTSAAGGAAVGAASLGPIVPHRPPSPLRHCACHGAAARGAAAGGAAAGGEDAPRQELRHPGADAAGAASLRLTKFKSNDFFFVKELLVAPPLRSPPPLSPPMSAVVAPPLRRATTLASPCPPSPLCRAATLASPCPPSPLRHAAPPRSRRHVHRCGNRLPLTTILRKMKADARSGNWPAVLVVRAE